MGCDYYHEAIRNDIDDSELSDESGELKIVVRVNKDTQNLQEKTMTVEVPVGGKVYVDKVTDDPIWSR